MDRNERKRKLEKEMRELRHYINLLSASAGSGYVVAYSERRMEESLRKDREISNLKARYERLKEELEAL